LKAKESNADLSQKLQDADERIRNLERDSERERAELKNSRLDHHTLYAKYLDLSKNYTNIVRLLGTDRRIIEGAISERHRHLQLWKMLLEE
jgi:DNA mismatch repair ATPase MutS